MHFGLQLPYVVPATRNDLLVFAQRADDGPFRTLTIGERITYDNPEQIVALAAAAAVTRRVRLLSDVTVLPLHPPALLAKAFATIDRLSEGRLIVTAGVGARREDFAAVGAPYTDRWQRVDDVVAALKWAWASEAAEPSGTVIGPPPYTPGGPPLHCAATGPKALARAVRWAVGYQGFTSDGSKDAMCAIAEQVTAAFAAVGRDRPELGVSCFFALGDGALARMQEVVGPYFGFADPDLQTAVLSTLTIASPDAIARTVSNAEAAGFDEVHFNPTTVDVAEIDRLEAVLSSM